MAKKATVLFLYAFAVDNMTTVTGTNSVTINSTGNTDIKGAVIANQKADGTDGGNLSLTTGSLSYSNIEDKDKARNFGMSSGSSIAVETSSNGENNIRATDSFGVNYSMHDITQETKATIGGGNITVGGTVIASDSAAISDLNRDINKSQEITSHTSVSPIDFSMTIRRDSEDGIENRALAKLAELRDMVMKPATTFTQSFKEISADLNVIGKDMQQNGDKNLGESVENFAKKLNNKSYAADRSLDIKTIMQLSSEAFENYDAVIEKYKNTDNPKGYLDDPQYDKFAHEKAAEQYGKYVGDADIAGGIRTIVEAGQFVGYGITYPLGIQDEYDPVGFYSFQNGAGRIKPILSGQRYRKDIIDDIQNVKNGAEGNYQFINKK